MTEIKCIAYLGFSLERKGIVVNNYVHDICLYNYMPYSVYYVSGSTSCILCATISLLTNLTGYTNCTIRKQIY